MLDKILGAIKIFPQKNQQFQTTGNELGGTVAISVALLVVIIVVTVLITRK